MRITDMLLTETPRPLLDDPVFTGFENLCPNPVVIDATDVAALIMEMSMRKDMDDLANDVFDEEAWSLIDAFGPSTGWQMSQFFTFDFTTIGNVAPPFDNFVIEVDYRDAMQKAGQAIGADVDQRRFSSVGRIATSVTVMDREKWLKEIKPGRLHVPATTLAGRLHDATMAEIEALPFRWIYTMVTWRYEPGRGLRGPGATYVVPVAEDGTLFVDDACNSNGKTLHALSLGPHDASERGHETLPEGLSNQISVTQGWQCIIPALMALGFMNTPRTTKEREGYHDLVGSEAPNARVARKYLERNFRPLTSWHTLDISPLRRALTEANGGEVPSTFEGIKKALHIVRGHTATYMPNTYFGRKHDKPITVFRPSYKRGDVKAGVAHKDYAVKT